MVSMAVVVSGCHVAIPPDLRPLEERTERIEVRYDPPADREPLLVAALRGSADFGPFHLAGDSGQLRVEERGRLVAQLRCSERQAVLMSRPPKPYHAVRCVDDAKGWNVSLELWAGVRVDASVRGGPCFRPRWPPMRTDPAVAKEPTAFRVYECGTDVQGDFMLGPLAGATVVTEDTVTLMLPTREPDRSLLATAFLVTLVFQKIDWLVERGPDRQEEL
jgi:hypothetical protein